MEGLCKAKITLFISAVNQLATYYIPCDQKEKYLI